MRDDSALTWYVAKPIHGVVHLEDFGCQGFSSGRFWVLPPGGVRVFRPLPPTAHLPTKRGGVMMIMMMICIDSLNYDDDLMTMTIIFQFW